MSIVGVNLDDVEEFEPLPKGSYLCRITKAEQVKASKTGADMISCEAEVAEGEHMGRMLFFNTMLKTKKGKANYYLKKLIEALGVEWSKKGFDTADMVGAEFVAIVEPPDPGQRFNKVVDYLAP